MTSPAEIQLHFALGKPQPEWLGCYLSLCEPTEGSALALQWDTSASHIGWDSWRWVTAHVQEELVGVIPAMLQGGRTATLWPPQCSRLLLNAGQPLLALADDEDDPAPVTMSVADRVAGQLLAELTAQMLREQMVLLQAVLPDYAYEDARRFSSAGFQHVADMLYMFCTGDALANAEKPARLTFRPYVADDRPLLCRLLEQTYEHTLDCPFLNGVRDTTDVLEGYLTSGVDGAAWWRLAEREGRVVGCVLVAMHRATGTAELVYMGVAPADRGNGYGLELIAEAQKLTVAAGMEQLALSVDAGNAPAIKAYEQAGFRTFDRRQVWLRYGADLSRHNLTQPISS